MRTNYPMSSYELNDNLLEAYAKYVYLLGYDNENGETTYSGIYDLNEDSLKDQHAYIVIKNDSAPTNNITEQSISKYLDNIKYNQFMRRI